jgi:hypothetical protein
MKRAVMMRHGQYADAEGNIRWYYDDRLHREDGPALEYMNGLKFWYYHGKYIRCTSQRQFDRMIKLKAFW